jgi:hydroxymethylbilane synthase
LRRKAQLLHLRPDLIVEDIRGNVETRLRKLEEREFDAIVLAQAGLKRLGLAAEIAHVIPREEMLPAVGQGALAIEARTDDAATQSLLASLDDGESHQCVIAERSLLFELRAGCSAPVGGWARIEGGQLLLDVVVLSADGRRRMASSGISAAADATELGQRVAADLLAQGAADLIAGSRQS